MTRATSSSGTPKIRNSTKAGSAHAKSRTMSACPSRSRSLQNLTVNSRTNGSISATRLGVKATLAIFRTRVWAGGSTFAKVGTDFKSAFLKRLGRHRARRTQRRVSVGSGEQRRRAEDLPDVMVAGDDPVIDQFAVKGRRGAAAAARKGYGSARYSGLSGSKPTAGFSCSAVRSHPLIPPRGNSRGASRARRRERWHC